MLTCPKCKVPKDAASYTLQLRESFFAVAVGRALRAQDGTVTMVYHGTAARSTGPGALDVGACGSPRDPRVPPPWPSTCPGSVSSRPGSRGSKTLAPSALAPRGQALIQHAAHQGPFKKGKRPGKVPLGTGPGCSWPSICITSVHEADTNLIVKDGNHDSHLPRAAVKDGNHDSHLPKRSIGDQLLAISPVYTNSSIQFQAK